MDGAFPAVADQDAYLQPACAKIAADYAGGDQVITDKKLTVYWDNVTEDSWKAGSRKVNCNLAALLPDRSGFAPVTGSVKGAVTVGDQPAPPAPTARRRAHPRSPTAHPEEEDAPPSRRLPASLRRRPPRQSAHRPTTSDGDAAGLGAPPAAAGAVGAAAAAPRSPAAESAWQMRLTRREFEGLVADALDTIPPDLLAAMDNVVVLVEGRNAADPELLGLYEGVALTERPATTAACSPTGSRSTRTRSSTSAPTGTRWCTRSR